MDFGFRLPSALDNRPLCFEEFLERIGQSIYVSATPGPWERERAQGIVVEGFGAGNVPPGVLEEIRAAIAAHIPVVLTSRCIEGGVWPLYGYKGGANELRDLGVILGGSLRAPKARILLMAALGMARGLSGLAKMEAVRAAFQAY